jgi:hypothetical protein
MPAVIDVSVTGRAPRNRNGVRFHEVKRIEWCTVKGLKVTTPLQTLKVLGFPDCSTSTGPSTSSWSRPTAPPSATKERDDETPRGTPR